MSTDPTPSEAPTPTLDREGRWHGLPPWAWPGLIRTSPGTNKFIDKGWNADAQDRYRGGVDVSSWVLEIEQWIAEGGNVGWCPPPNILVLDLDNEEAVGYERNRAPKRRPFNARGLKGHAFYAYDRDVLTLWNKSVSFDVGSVEPAKLDVRVATNRDGSIGGGGIVIPPSKRTDKAGGDYNWTRKLPMSIEDVPEVPEEIAYMLSGLFAEGVKSRKPKGSVSRHDQLRNAIYLWVQTENANTPEVSKENVRRKAEAKAAELFSGDAARVKEEVADLDRSIDGAWELAAGRMSGDSSTSDLDIAKTFLHYHEDAWRYATNRDRWYWWNGVHWHNAGSKFALRSELHTFAGHYIDAAADEQPGEKRERLIAVARRLNMSSGVDQVYKAVQSIVAVDMDVFDSQLHLTTFPASEAHDVPAVTFNALTGEVYPPRAEDFITAIGAAPFIEGAQSDEVDAYLDSMFPDEEVRDFALQVLGQSMQGDLRQNEHFVVLAGPPASGKSTLLELVTKVLGDRVVVGARSVIDGDGEAQTKDFSIIHLRGKTVAYFDEARSVKFGENMKRIVSGNQIVAHVKRQDDEVFESTARPFITTNTLPTVKFDDDGLKRRAILLYVGGEQAFEEGVTNPDVDRGLKQRLMNDPLALAALLQRMVAGLVEVDANGGYYELPKTVERWVDEWFADSDPLKAWFESGQVLLTGDENDRLTSAFEHYGRWAKSMPGRALSPKAFGQVMKRRALRVARQKGKTVYYGMKLVGADGAAAARAFENSDDHPNSLN